MCKISLAPSGNLRLHIPSEQGSGHHVEIPATEGGLRILLSILREQAKAGPKTIGTRAAPTSTDKALLDVAAYMAEQQRAEAKAELDFLLGE